MSSKAGTLILGAYKEMEVNRPIPWIGMPVYYYGHWYLVEGEYGGFAATNDQQRTNLATYRINEPGTGAFRLPGEPDAPCMNDDFVSQLARTYLWSKCVRYVDGLWQVVTMPCHSDRHTALPLPGGVEMSDVFPNNEASSSVEDLKKSNTDGRLNCASCSCLLKQSWFGNVNMNYCPVCEG